jgi:hypothetical protein
MDVTNPALYIFRKMVYLVYLEIGALTPRVHPELAAKAFLKTAYFQREKERQALELYRYSEGQEDVDHILAPYVERTNLTLEEVHRVLSEGDWRNKFGGYNFGGPKWEKIAEMTLALRDAIRQGDQEVVDEVLFEIKRFKTNQGYLINMFERTERKRQ